MGRGALGGAISGCGDRDLPLDVDLNFYRRGNVVLADIDPVAIEVHGEVDHIVQLRRVIYVVGIFESGWRCRGLDWTVVMTAMGVATSEVSEHFECFGGTCTVLVAGAGPAGRAPTAVAMAKRRLLEWHGQFSRFERSSELSRLNRDQRTRVPVSPMMTRFVAAALYAAEMTGGLVDPTLLTEVEQAGYACDLGSNHTPPRHIADLPRWGRPAAPSLQPGWLQVTVDRRAGVVMRPAGVRIDSGGVAKGLFGDVLAGVLSLHESFVVAAAGDVRLGGVAGTRRSVQVTSPFEPGHIVHTFELARGAVATSGTTKRSWLNEQGELAHHLLDPSTGKPAFTGVVQATALATTGVEAEARAKAALLAGPSGAAEWLANGGVIVHDDGTVQVIDHNEAKALA